MRGHCAVEQADRGDPRPSVHPPRALLREALTHRSALHGTRRGARGSNERLEFIGDRVLGLVMAEWLAERFPHEQEGELGRRLALSGVAAGAGRGGRERSAWATCSRWRRARRGPACKRRATVLADALEAAIGALYLDGGLDGARAVRPPRLGRRDDGADRAAEGRQDQRCRNGRRSARRGPAGLRGDRAVRPAARAGVRRDGARSGARSGTGTRRQQARRRATAAEDCCERGPRRCVRSPCSGAGQGT